MNDLWKLPGGQWVVYTSNADLLREFSSLRPLKLMATYTGLIKRHRAMQFMFPPSDDLLKYICYKTGMNYSNLFLLNKRPGVSYSQLFPKDIFQPRLLGMEEYDKKKKSAKKVKE